MLHLCYFYSRARVLPWVGTYQQSWCFDGLRLKSVEEDVVDVQVVPGDWSSAAGVESSC
jgi:hypothetical protein